MNKVLILVVLLIPVKEPVAPRPTLAVAIPIRSRDIGAANKVWPSARVNTIVPSVDTPKAVPSFVL